MRKTMFDAALEKLGPTTPLAHSTMSTATSIDELVTRERPVVSTVAADPERFLLQVMNDDTVSLALRIEAAKALLQHSNGDRSQRS
jgi:hypothetical protein